MTLGLNPRPDDETLFLPYRGYFIQGLGHDDDTFNVLRNGKIVSTHSHKLDALAWVKQKSLESGEIVPDATMTPDEVAVTKLLNDMFDLMSSSIEALCARARNGDEAADALMIYLSSAATDLDDYILGSIV